MPHHGALLTDLYELTMAAGYQRFKPETQGTFELFVRALPKQRGYLVLAGIEQALDYITSFRFKPEELDYLRQQPIFSRVEPEFFDYLAEMRFTGDVWAMQEGTIFFPGEPVLQVQAPLAEAQILETYLLSMITFQSMVATKASRVVMAARKRPVVDFGSRRAHGPEAALLAARASYIGGVQATSNVLAGKTFEMPITGTCAHSWVQSFDTEEEAFRAFNDVFPDHSILLIDTYDTLEGARLAIRTGKNVKGVRIDSGDLSRLAKKVRQILDSEGRPDIQIVASSDLDEYKIDDMVREGAPIDMFGVGTEMVTSADAPSLGAVYKLVQTESAEGVRLKIKLSRNKVTYPGRKQVVRRYGTSGTLYQDVIGCAEEAPGRDGRALLEKVVENGELTRPHPELSAVRSYADKEIATVPDRLRKLRGSQEYQVVYSALLEQRLREERRRSHHERDPQD